MTAVALPIKPRVMPHDDRTGGPLDAPRVIVVHTTEGGEGLDSAEGLARFVSGPKQTSPYVNVASYHWVCDANSVIPLAPENVVAFHAAGANAFSIGLCITGKAGQTPEQWADEMSGPAVEWAARLCGERARALRIPLRRLTVAELAAGHAGICGHDDVRAAFRRTTHTDPGPHFPWGRFMALAADQIAPPVDTTPFPEDDMVQYIFRDTRYYDEFLMPDCVPVSGRVRDMLVAKSVPRIEEQHDQTLDAILRHLGRDRTSLAKVS